MYELMLAMTFLMQPMTYVFVHVLSRKRMFSCGHVCVVDRFLFRRLLHSSSGQNFLIIDFIAPSSRLAEKVDSRVAVEADFGQDFGVKACLANSRYSLIQSSIVICSLPSIIAMILSQSAWYYFHLGRESASPSSACPSNQVKLLAWSRDAV